MQKAVVFLYTSDKLSEIENLKKNPIYNCIKNSKISTNKWCERPELYTENYEILKEVEYSIGKWKFISFTLIERINIVKMIIPPKAIYN